MGLRTTGETIFLEMDKKDVKLCNKILSKKKRYKEGEEDVIRTIGVAFTPRISADIKLVDSFSGPYVDAILFDRGNEAVVIDPVGENTMLGEYIFEYEGITYQVVIQEAKI